MYLYICIYDIIRTYIYIYTYYSLYCCCVWGSVLFYPHWPERINIPWRFQGISPWYHHDTTGEIPWIHHVAMHPLRTASWIKVQYGIHRSLSQSLKKAWHQRRVRRRRQTRLRRFAARDLLGSEIHKFMVYVLRPWSALEAIHGIITCKLHSCVYIYIYTLRQTDRQTDT